MFILAFLIVFFFKQQTAYVLRISDWSSDVFSSELRLGRALPRRGRCRGGTGSACRRRGGRGGRRGAVHPAHLGRIASPHRRRAGERRRPRHGTVAIRLPADAARRQHLDDPPALRRPHGPPYNGTATVKKRGEQYG